MVNRTLQFQNGSYFSVIPTALIDALGLTKGAKVSFGIEQGKIIIAPVVMPAKTEPQGAAITPARDVTA